MRVLPKKCLMLNHAKGKLVTIVLMPHSPKGGCGSQQQSNKFYHRDA